MATKKKTAAKKATKRASSSPSTYERLGDQITFRVRPALRERLEALAASKGLRGIGEAAREVLEQHA